MDIMSLLGIVLAFSALIGGSILKGAGVKALASGAAFVIVLVGTISAIFLQTPLKTLKRAAGITSWVFKPPQTNVGEIINKLVEWSKVARKEGLLGLESDAENEPDVFMKKGLQMVVDGGEPKVIRKILEVELDASEAVDLKAAKVYEAMGIYAPTLGIIGAVMGLMAVMQNLADPDKLGPGIAAAFVATIYGIASANMFFLPMASKLKTTIEEISKAKEMIIDGLASIAEGENPANIDIKLRSYFMTEEAKGGEKEKA